MIMKIESPPVGWLLFYQEISTWYSHFYFCSETKVMKKTDMRDLQGSFGYQFKFNSLEFLGY